MKKNSYTLVAIAVLSIVAVASALANGATPPAAPPDTGAQVSPPAGVGAGAAPVGTTQYATNQLIPLTVSEAWELSGRNEQNFARMIQQLAEVSARNRGVTFADTRSAGSELGQMIRQRIQNNPDELLYEAVDNAVVQFKATHPAPAGTGAGPAITTYSANELMPLSVSEVWLLSGKDYNTMSRSVKTLMEVAAQRRGIALPDTAEAGTELGRIIRRHAEADPNQLLYVVVDNALVEWDASRTSAQ